MDLNKYPIVRKYINVRDNVRPGTRLVSGNPLFFVAHDIGTGGTTAEENWRYFNTQTDRSASAQTFIDDTVILEMIPTGTGPDPAERAWHVIYNVTTDNQLFGDDANDVAIGTELCWTPNINPRKDGKIINFKEAYKRYVWYHAYLCYKFGKEPRAKITSHKKLDPDRKIDPDNALNAYGITFDQFINDVVVELNSGTKTTKGVTSPMEHGVIYHERFAFSGGLAMQVNRKSDGKIDYTVSGTDIRWVRLDRTRTHFDFVYEENAKVSGLVTKNNADLGFNFPFFYNGIVLGDNEDDDLVISSAYGNTLNRHEFWTVDGIPFIGQVVTSEHQDMVIQGAPLLLSDGNPCWDWFRIQENIPDDIGKARAQRTFVGIDANKDIILAICDGRTQWDMGLTLEEMCVFMQSRGAVFALNGDGGSSTVLANKTGSLGQNKGTSERAVHHAVLVKFIEPPVQEFDKETFISKFLSPAWGEAPNQSIKDIIHACAEQIRRN